MGNCCASGGRDGGFDQKEDKLTAPELKKEDGEITEKTKRPAEETPEDATFKEIARQIKTSNPTVDVRSYLCKLNSKCMKSWESTHSSPLLTTELLVY